MATVYPCLPTRCVTSVLSTTPDEPGFECSSRDVLGVVGAELVELVLHSFVGDDTTIEERQMVTRIGCRTRQPGLRSLDQLDPTIADDVTRRLIDVLGDCVSTVR